MTDRSAEILDALQKVLEARRAWDEDPEVLFLYRKNAVTFALPMPVPDVLWQMHSHPPTVLAVIAKAIGATRTPPPHPGDLIGVAFRCETFGISSDSSTPQAREAARRRMAGGSTPRFEHIPGRLEQRYIYAVDTGGSLYSVAGTRQEDDSMGPADRVHVAPGSGDGFRGNIPNALRLMLDNLQGAMR